MGMVAHYLLLVAGMILQVVALEWLPGGGWGPKCFLFDVFADTFDASWLLFLECTYPKINMEPETGPLERKNIDGKTTNLWVPS